MHHQLPRSLVTEEWDHGNSGGKTAPKHHGDDKNNASQWCSLHVGVLASNHLININTSTHGKGSGKHGKGDPAIGVDRR